MDPNSKDYKKLEALWYKKIAKAGFVDAERRTKNNEHELKLYTIHITRGQKDATWVESKSEYYRLAGQFFHDHKFSNLSERLVWEYHQNGIPVRDIVDRLDNDHGIFIGKKDTINKMIRRLAKIMYSKVKHAT